MFTVKFLNFRTPEIFPVIYLKFKQRGQTFSLYRVFGQKDAYRIANSEDADQTAPSSLIWVCTVCPDMSVRQIRIITVYRAE